MTKKEFKEFIEASYSPKGDVLEWELSIDGREFLTIDGSDPGISIDDEFVYLHEGEPAYTKIPLRDAPAILSAIENYEEDSDAAAEAFPEFLSPNLFCKNEEVVEDFKKDLEILVMRYNIKEAKVKLII